MVGAKIKLEIKLPPMLGCQQPLRIPAQLTPPEEIAALSHDKGVKIIAGILGTGEIKRVAGVDRRQQGNIRVVALHPGKVGVDIVHVGFGRVFRGQAHVHGHRIGLDATEHRAIPVHPMMTAAERMPVMWIEAQTGPGGSDLIQVDGIHPAFMHQAMANSDYGVLPEAGRRTHRR